MVVMPTMPAVVMPTMPAVIMPTVPAVIMPSMMFLMLILIVSMFFRAHVLNDPCRHDYGDCGINVCWNCSF